MSLLTVAEARALINTSLSDPDLQDVIDRLEAEIAARIGAPQNDGNTVTVAQTLAGKTANVFVKSEIGSVSSVIEDGTTLAATEYRSWSGGIVERLPAGNLWGEVVTVTYKPADTRLERKAATIDLLRIELNRTAMLSESIAGEYSYSAPQNWEAERKRILKRLAFPVAG